jgi:hypothetical protein
MTGGVQEGVGVISVRRTDKGYPDRFRAYRVFVDGKECGRVKRGGTVSIPAAEGRHVVHLRIDWCRSRPQHVVVAQGSTTELVCYPGSDFGWLFHPRNYCHLEVVR